MHLKWCDFDAYVQAMDRRNAVTEQVGAAVSQAAIGRHWFAEARGEDRTQFEAFAELEMEEGFDLGWVRRKMHRSFGPRGDTGFFAFRRPEYRKQYRLPERFTGLF